MRQPPKILVRSWLLPVVCGFTNMYVASSVRLEVLDASQFWQVADEIQSSDFVPFCCILRAQGDGLHCLRADNVSHETGSAACMPQYFAASPVSTSTPSCLRSLSRMP